MGLFQHQYSDWREAVDFGSCARKFVTCDFCGQQFEANSPNQKRHRRNYELQGEGDYLDAAACEDEQWKASLGRRSFVTRILGMSVKDFIEIHGRTEYESL